VAWQAASSRNAALVARGRQESRISIASWIEGSQHAMTDGRLDVTCPIRRGVSSLRQREETDQDRVLNLPETGP
jgi:pantothenate synthetase